MNTIVPMVLLIAELPVTASAPPRLAHLSKLTVASVVSTSSRTILAIMPPTKKMIPAPSSLGMKPMKPLIRSRTGPITLVSSSAWSTAIRPNSQMNSETIRPSEAPMLSPEAADRANSGTRSTSLAKDHLAAFASIQTTARITATMIAFWPSICASSGSKRYPAICILDIRTPFVFLGPGQNRPEWRGYAC